MTREDYDAMCVLVFDELQRTKDFGAARCAANDLLGVVHMNILEFGAMIKRGRELKEKPHAV